MTLESLLVSKDKEAETALRQVLSGFGLSVQRCGYSESIIPLTQQKFDVVIVDFDDPDAAALALQNASQTSSEQKTVTVALLNDRTKVRNVFGAGANFVLYKPISQAQAETSLRTAIALVKRERRRAPRIPVQVPVQLRVPNGSEAEGILLDLSEDGLDVLAAQPLCPSAAISARFALADPGTELQVSGEVAWANPNGESGIRFVDLPENIRASLRQWIEANSSSLPPDEPEPICQFKLSDLSLNACYVETESPFPERSGVLLCLNAAGMEVQAGGTVRVMHPGFGMGIEFASRTAGQREQVEQFISFLSSQPGTQPQLLITPRSLAAGELSDSAPEAAGLEDPLLQLIRQHEALSQEDFLQVLRKQRTSEEVASS